MPCRSYKKPYRAKRKKPLLAKASFWRSVGMVSATGGLVWVICFCPALEVKEVNVEGAQKISDKDCVQLIQDEINKKVAFFDSKSILLFDLDEAKKEILAKYPQIQDIKIERQFPSKIYASVEERRGVAVYADSRGKRFFVDSEGFAFEEAGDDAGVIQIINSRSGEVGAGGQAISKDLLSGILKMKGEIDAAGQVLVASAEIATPERINLLTSEGWYIYFNPLKDINEQLVKLNAVLIDETFNSKRSNLGYVDIRFTRVYLKEKDEFETESTGEAVLQVPENEVAAESAEEASANNTEDNAAEEASASNTEAQPVN